MPAYASHRRSTPVTYKAHHFNGASQEPNAEMAPELKMTKTVAIDDGAHGAARTAPQQFPPLESVTRPAVPTGQAAYYLDRQAQTLRIWAMRRSGPLVPIRVHGRLAWPVNGLKQLLGVTE